MKTSASGAEHVTDLVFPPDVERALHLVLDRWIAGLLRRHAVGILGREEATTRIGEVGPHVVERVDGHVGVEAVAGELGRLDVREHQLRLVVQHLLEVRHTPVGIHRVAVESSAEVVAHPAKRHRAQRHEHHVPRFAGAGPCVLAQQEQQLARPRELRRAAEPAAPAIEGDRELFGRALEDGRAPAPAHDRRASEDCAAAR